MIILVLSLYLQELALQWLLSVVNHLSHGKWLNKKVGRVCKFWGAKTVFKVTTDWVLWAQYQVGPSADPMGGEGTNGGWETLPPSLKRPFMPVYRARGDSAKCAGVVHSAVSQRGGARFSWIIALRTWKLTLWGSKKMFWGLRRCFNVCKCNLQRYKKVN